MPGQRYHALLILFLAFVCMAATYAIWGFYYTDYQAFASALFSGKLTPGVPFRSLYFIANYGTSYPYSYLYQWFPSVEWLSWIYALLLLLACFTGFYLVSIALPHKTPLRNRVLLLVAVYFLVFADNETHFICSHISYITSGLALIALVCLFSSWQDIKNRWLLFAALNLFFTFGALTRVESGTACFMLVAAFSLFYLNNIRLGIILLLYPFILVVALSVAISTDIKTSTEFYKQIEPDIEAQFENRGNKAPLSIMKTHRDSVLYNTASDIVWSDPKVITPSFLRSMILPEGILFTDAKQWQRVYKNMGSIVYKYWYLALLQFLLALAVLLLYPLRRLSWKLLFWLAFELSFWVLITAQTYVYKLNDRSFTPYISLFIFCHIILLLQNRQGAKPILYYLLLPFIGLLWAVQFYHFAVEANSLKKDQAQYKKNYEKLKLAAAGKYLVLNSSSCDYVCLSSEPFKPFDFSAFKRIYVTEGSAVPFIYYYRLYLENDCHCNMYNYPVFYDYLKTLPSDVVFVSTPSRMQTIRTYLLEIYQYNLPLSEVNMPFEKVQKNENRQSFDNLKIYRLEK